MSASDRAKWLWKVYEATNMAFNPFKYGSKNMKFLFNHWLFKLPWMNRFEAITLAPFLVLFRQAKEEVNPAIIRHELVHVAQIKRLGVLRFYCQYVYEWVRNLFRYRFDFMKAYEEISFEKEAYEHEDDDCLS